MDLARLFPKSAKKNNDKYIDNLLYTCLVDWGWSYDQFINTPFPVLQRLLKTHKEVTNKRNKK